MTSDDGGMTRVTGMQRRKRFRRALTAIALAGSAVLAVGCRTQPAGDQPLQLWTLALAPKFNTYMEGWSSRGRRITPRSRCGGRISPGGRWSASCWRRCLPHGARSGQSQPPFAANLASKGGLTDLTPLLPEGAADRYPPSVWQASRDPQAGQIAVPWYLTVRLNLVNQQLLQQAGVQAPPRRWRDVPAFAKTIRERTGRYALFVTVVPDDSAELLESMVQMGVTLLDGKQRAAFATPEGRQAFAFWVDLYRQGLLPREVVSQGQNRAVELYQSGELALLAKGPEFLTRIQTNAPQVAAATASHPPLAGADGTANVALMTLAVPRQSSRPREAVALALFLTNGPNQARFVREAPVLPSSLEALAQVRAELAAERPTTPQAVQLRQARLLSLDTLERARVLVPSTPGIKRLRASSTPSCSERCSVRSPVIRR